MEQAKQTDLNLLMSGNALFLFKPVTDMISQTDTNMEQIIFPGGLMQRGTGFHHMPGAVKFMTFQQVCPAVPGFFYRKIGIQITIFLLAAAYERYQFIHPFRQFMIRFQKQGIGSRFQPFSHVTVLKDHSVECSGFFTCSHAKIADGVRFFCFRHFIPQDFFHIRNGHVCYKFLAR